METNNQEKKAGRPPKEWEPSEEQRSIFDGALLDLKEITALLEAVMTFLA